MQKFFRKSFQWEGRELIVETGKLAPLANAAVMVTYCQVQALVTATSTKSSEVKDFLPLRVDYEERLYAGGLIKNSRFIKREGKSSDDSILSSRLIDRSIRPLFPKGFTDEVQIVVTVISVDGENDHSLLGLVGAIIALEISDIPFASGLGSAVIAYNNGEYIKNPTKTQLKDSQMELLVSATPDRIVMVEAESHEVDEAILLKGFESAWESINQLVSFIAELKTEMGKEKFLVEDMLNLKTVVSDLTSTIEPKIKEIYDMKLEKKAHDQKINLLKKEMEAASVEKGYTTLQHSSAFYEIEKHFVQEFVLSTKKRVDGRGLKDIRPLYSEVAMLERCHGSALFQRGLTQVMSVVTLGSSSLGQLSQTMEGDEEKFYMHHYNALPYSTGEVGAIRGPGRREIGHGELAEKALRNVIPSIEDFPYTIRVVSEVLAQNGSSSMASTCGSTLALMDAGVPIKAHVGGVSVGLIEGEKEWVLITDIQGLEDFFGHMDFKIAGTRKGITAIQLDVKNTGMTKDMLEQAVSQSKDGRLEIIAKLEETMPVAREAISEYAPAVAVVMIKEDQIGMIIGSGGKTIKGLMADTNTDINVDDSGKVTIAAQNREDVARAKAIVEGMVKEVEVGEIYTGEVVNITDFGAFINILPGKDGLLHISEIANERIARVEDVLHLGEMVEVKVIDTTPEGKIALSRKALLPGGGESRSDYQEKPRGPRNSGRHDDRRSGNGGKNNPSTERKPHPDSEVNPEYQGRTPHFGGFDN